MSRPATACCARWPVLLLVTLLASSGCAGEGAGGSAGSGDASLTAIQQEIFTPSCASFGCHDPVIQAAELVLSSVELSHAELVGVASTLCAGRTLVVAGDPDASYLLDKVGASSDRCGLQMPPVLSSLSNEQLQQIRAWIEAGAELPASTTTTSSSTITTSSSTTLP